MDWIDELLELLNTPILYIFDNMVTNDKATLQSVLTCLQALQAKVELLQIQTQLLHDEFQRKFFQQYVLVIV